LENIEVLLAGEGFLHACISSLKTVLLLGFWCENRSGQFRFRTAWFRSKAEIIRIYNKNSNGPEIKLLGISYTVFLGEGVCALPKHTCILPFKVPITQFFLFYNLKVEHISNDIFRK
jgi:hypothetical protein